MTDRERWERSDDPEELAWVGSWNSVRKENLLGVACCRRIWSLLDHPSLREAVEVIERHADRETTDADLRRVSVAARGLLWATEERVQAACRVEATRLGLPDGWQRIADACGREQGAAARAVWSAAADELPSVFEACA